MVEDDAKRKMDEENRAVEYYLRCTCYKLEVVTDSERKQTEQAINRTLV